jgi:periplasmic protein TonB
LSRRKKKGFSPLFIISLGAHLAIGAGLALVPQKKLREVVAIALNEAPEPKKDAEPPKPKEDAPAPKPERVARRAPRSNAAPEGSPTDASPPQQALTDLGLTLDSSAIGGLAVRMAPTVNKEPAPVIAALVKPKLTAPKPSEASCIEQLIKARPMGVVRPSYTDAARRARIEGRVRIELNVNEQGVVTSARVIEGLGFGLDEAAIESAKRLKFAPATQCNRAVAAPFVIAMRFVLGT